MTRFSILARLIITTLALPSALPGSDQQFFARHTHPLTITPDGSRLLALNSAEGRLSVFAVGENPLLISEIPVGLLPVSVRLRTADEAWVINELSDAISVVSLSQNAVIASIPTGDEPADVAFAQGKAFVTCSRDNSVQVIDPVRHELIDTIALEGLMPRSIVASPDGSKLYTTFLNTSNGTTILPRDKAPAQDIPANINPELPAPPKVAQIVPISHPEITYDVLDHDLATLDPISLTVTSYTGDLGTNILNTAVAPNGDLLIANSEARNLIALEPNLRARFARTRVAHLGTTTIQIDLNPDPDLSFPTIDSNARDQTLAQVMAILPTPDSSHAWLAAFGSDRLVRLDLTDHSLSGFIDLRTLDSADTPRSGQTVRGPRGLALHPTAPRLFVLNRLSHTLSTIDTDRSLVLSETSLSSHPDLDPVLKKGRAFLFDARLSGNGTVSCATCHIDLDRDAMAWDLGDPSGEMLTLKGALLSLHAPNSLVDRSLHPMKGPMITQTLIGLAEQTKLHWRGDKPNIQSFNPTFPNLLAADPLPDAEIDAVAAYLLNLKHHPNPHLQLDRNFPETIAGGDPIAGISVFTLFDNHCSACHLLPSGSSNNLDIPSTVGSFQPLKDAPLRTTYQRNHFNPTPGESSLTGFGLGSDGSHHELPIAHPYSLHILDDINRPLASRLKDKRDLTAFILAFDTGTAPAIGHAVTVRETPSVEQLSEIATLEAQANLAELSGVGLVVRGHYQGIPRSFRYHPSGKNYQASTPRIAPLSSSNLIAGMSHGDRLTFLGVPLAETASYSIDRDLNNIPDDSPLPPVLTLDTPRHLSWPSNRPGWFPESSPDFLQWTPLTQPVSRDNTSFQLSDPTTSPRAFYRLKRSW